MIKKLTIKEWMGTGIALLMCLVLAVPALWYFGPSALAALRGSVPELAETQSMTNIYGMSALGLFFLLLALFILGRKLSDSVGKRVRRYLESRPDVTEEQLDSDFNAAEKIGNIWIGRRWTFSHELRCVLLENEGIVWVFSETERVKNGKNYYLCFGLVSGKIERVKVREQDLTPLIERYGKNPRILAGSNPEYSYMFKNNLASFLNLKYNADANAGEGNK